MEINDLKFYKGKHVFVTGHTGFKGTWLCNILINAGAIVNGYSLPAPTSPNLFKLAGIEYEMNSVIGDIRDFEHLKNAFETACPEIVFHLAAQPIVRDSYKNPKYTYETNALGTLNLMECIRLSDSVRSVVNVTTDKVYKNNEWCWGYRETEPLDGFDPYSNSKSCSELITHSYINSFFLNRPVAVSTARAGNVLGGGDFANDRIIPDCMRAIKLHQAINVRNPQSTRPFQHVLEPLSAYLTIAMKQYIDKTLAGAYNVGPNDCDCITTGKLVDMLCQCWGSGAAWKTDKESNAPHEANFLKLDCSKIKSIIGWEPRWNIKKCIEMTCAMNKVILENGCVTAEMNKEIQEFFTNANV
jgi:CDP-glucose 4,6-dehydratase